MPVEYRRALNELEGGGHRGGMTLRARRSSCRSVLESLMGKITGFLESNARTGDYEPVAERLTTIANSSCRCREAGLRDAGRALHGLRRALLSHRLVRPPPLPGQQPDPGLERPRLSRRLGRGARATCTRPTISRNSPAASARRRARRPARSTSTRTRSPSRSIECAIVDRAIRRLDQAGAADARRPARRSRSSARARRARLRAAARARRPRRACL